jgi:hypothetical protein
LFDPAGGGLVLQNFYQWGTTDPAYDPVGTSSMPGSLVFMMFAVEGLGSTQSDLFFSVWAISPSICRAINRILGVTWSGIVNAGGNVYWSGAVDETWFTNGTPTLTGVNIAARSAFCQESNGYGFFFRAIVIR